MRSRSHANYYFTLYYSVAIVVLFLLTIILSYKLLTIEQKQCPNEFPQIQLKHEKLVNKGHETADSQHQLALLIPFRERFKELLIFAPYIHDFLNRQKVQHHIFVLNQIDKYRFNRASLINVGYLYTKADYDYIAMHDVDLLPLNDNLSYAYPEKQPFHVASPELHPRYHYAKFVGGILLVNREHFAQVDGMSNKYWGWGLEDDEFFVRLREAKLNISRPTGITTGTNNTFRHIHDKHERKRDTVKCFNQREVTRKRDRETGLHNVQHKIRMVNEMEIDGAPVTVINIELICDKVLTPWCECNE